MPTPPTIGGNRQMDLASNSNSPACSSPGAQTLATVRRGPISEQRQAGRQASTRARARGQARPRRRVGRVMKEGKH